MTVEFRSVYQQDRTQLLSAPANDVPAYPEAADLHFYGSSVTRVNEGNSSFLKFHFVHEGMRIGECVIMEDGEFQNMGPDTNEARRIDALRYDR